MVSIFLYGCNKPIKHPKQITLSKGGVILLLEIDSINRAKKKPGTYIINGDTIHKLK